MKNGIKIVVKLFLLLGFMLVSVLVLRAIFNPEKPNDGVHFRNLPKNSLDILIFGSSQAQYSLNPVFIYEKTGLYSYVLGSPCQPVPVSYQYLKEALLTQSPKVVVLDVFTLLPASSVCASNGIVKTGADNLTGIRRYMALSYIEDKEVFWNYAFDLQAFHSRWRDIGWHEFVADTGFNESMGCVIVPPEEFEFRYLVPFQVQDNHYPLPEKDVAALLDIIALCKEKGIQLYLVKTPFDTDQASYDALQAVWDIAHQHQVEVVDYLKLANEIGFALGIHGDTWHNNVWGSYRVSNHLASKIADEVEFDHHENKQIDNLLKELTDVTLYQFLCELPDPYQYFRFVSSYDVILLVQYQGMPTTSIGESEATVLNQAGINFDFIDNYNENYYAVVVNGQTLVSSTEEVEVEVEGHQIFINETGIWVDGNPTTEQKGELLVTVIPHNFGWMNSIDIDYSSRFFWKNGYDGFEKNR